MAVVIFFLVCFFFYISFELVQIKADITSINDEIKCLSDQLEHLKEMASKVKKPKEPGGFWWVYLPHFGFPIEILIGVIVFCVAFQLNSHQLLYICSTVMSQSLA